MSCVSLDFMWAVLAFMSEIFVRCIYSLVVRSFCFSKQMEDSAERILLCASWGLEENVAMAVSFGSDAFVQKHILSGIDDGIDILSDWEDNFLGPWKCTTHGLTFPQMTMHAGQNNVPNFSLTFLFCPGAWAHSLPWRRSCALCDFQVNCLPLSLIPPQTRKPSANLI